MARGFELELDEHWTRKGTRRTSRTAFIEAGKLAERAYRVKLRSRIFLIFMKLPE